MRLTGFSALSFDCYGTLIDWETGILAALRPWAEAAGLASGEALLEAYAEQEARAEASYPRQAYPQILARAMRGLGERLGVPVADADAERFARSVGDWPAFPDSRAALAELGQRYQLLILSNVDRESFAASAARLGTRFAAVITAEDVGSYKPSPRNFAALLAEASRLGIGRDRLLHVAQSLYHDHAPAKAAGLATAWVNRRHGRPGWGATPPPPAGVQPDWEFPSLRALADAVAGERPG
jgi:2-haloacid dehalogenase